MRSENSVKSVSYASRSVYAAKSGKINHPYKPKEEADPLPLFYIHIYYSDGAPEGSSSAAPSASLSSACSTSFFRLNHPLRQNCLR